MQPIPMISLHWRPCTTAPGCPGLGEFEVCPGDEFATAMADSGMPVDRGALDDLRERFWSGLEGRGGLSGSVQRALGG